MFIIFLLMVSHAMGQENDTIRLQSREDSLLYEIKPWLTNAPGQDAIMVLNKFLSCYYFRRFVEVSAPIMFSDYNFKDVKSVKIKHSAFSVPVYYAEFYPDGRYNAINYYSVYEENPYHTLNFNYDKKEIFAEVVNTYGDKNIIQDEYYAIEDTIFLKIKAWDSSIYLSKIYVGDFDVFERTFYNFDTHAFDTIGNKTRMDENWYKCLDPNTHCTYSEISKKVFKYKYSHDSEYPNGYELIYFNERYLISKVEIMLNEKGPKTLIDFIYKYY